jgi:O-antigen/teichoic acid export membrane protein
MGEHSYSRNSLYLLSSQVVALVCGLFGQIILANWLDPTGYGMVIILIDLGLTLAILIDFGIPTWMANFWDGKEGSVKQLVGNGMKLEYRLALFMSGGFLVTALIGDYLSLGNLEKMLDPETFLIIFSGFILILAEPYRLGLRLIIRTEFEAISRAIERVFIVMGYGILAYFDRVSVFSVGVVIFVSCLFTLLLTIIMFNKLAPDSEQGNEKSIHRSKILKASFPYAVATMAYPLVARTDKFILAILENAESVGVYNIGWIVVGFGFVITNKLRQAILPLLAECKTHEQRSEVIINSKIPNVILAITGIIICVSVCYLILDRVFPSDLIEAEGISGLQLIICLLPSWFWSMFCTSRLESIKFHDDVWLYAKVINSSILVNALVGYLLVTMGLSILGVLIGSTTAQFYNFLISHYFTRIRARPSTAFLWEFALCTVVTVALFGIGITDFGQEFVVIGSEIIVLIMSLISLFVMYSTYRIIISTNEMARSQN